MGNELTTESMEIVAVVHTTDRMVQQTVWIWFNTIYGMEEVRPTIIPSVHQYHRRRARGEEQEGFAKFWARH